MRKRTIEREKSNDRCRKTSFLHRSLPFDLFISATEFTVQFSEVPSLLSLHPSDYHLSLLNTTHIFCHSFLFFLYSYHFSSLVKLLLHYRSSQSLCLSLSENGNDWQKTQKWFRFSYHDHDDAYSLKTDSWGSFASWKNLSTDGPYW